MFKTITKAELIEALADLNDDDQIAFTSDYGDRCHTQQLHRIKGNIDEMTVRESAYSDSGFAVADDDHITDDGDPYTVFVLN